MNSSRVQLDLIQRKMRSRSVIVFWVCLIAFMLIVLGCRYDISQAIPADKRICKRTMGENVFLLADDDTLTRMNRSQSVEMYWNYINTLQVLCRNQTRLGSLKDGGKAICSDENYKPQRPCLVYSFGSNFMFDFELSVIRSFKCEVHTFNPSRPIKAHTFPHGIHFHLHSNKTGRYGWNMNNLDDIRKKLNHEERMIDVLKIDIEGAEWNALPDMYQSGVLKFVKQLCIDIHFGEAYMSSDVSLRRQIKVLRSLSQHGFQIFMHEHKSGNKEYFKYLHQDITMLNEISLINVNLKCVS